MIRIPSFQNLLEELTRLITPEAAGMGHKLNHTLDTPKSLGMIPNGGVMTVFCHMGTRGGTFWTETRKTEIYK